MQEVILKEPRVINGAVRYPVEGPIPVSDDEYDRLVDAKAIDAGEPDDDEDGLEAKTVAELKQIVADEGVDVAEATRKAEIVAAIRAHRLAA